MDTPEPTPPRGFKFYAKWLVLLIIVIVVITEVNISLSTGVSVNSEILNKLLDTLILLLSPEEL